MGQLRSCCEDLLNEYKGARERMDTRGDGSATSDFVMVPAGPSLGRAALAADPRKLVVALKTLQTTVIAQIAAALNENAARIMVGLDIGRRTSELAGDYIEVLLLGRPPELIVAENGSAMPEDVLAFEAAKERRVWTRLAIDAGCTAMGDALGWAMRGWAALWTTCSFGAQLCIEAGAADRNAQPSFHLVTIVGAVGFAYQAQYWGKAPLPG